MNLIKDKTIYKMFTSSIPVILKVIVVFLCIVLVFVVFGVNMSANITNYKFITLFIVTFFVMTTAIMLSRQLLRRQKPETDKEEDEEGKDNRIAPLARCSEFVADIPAYNKLLCAHLGEVISNTETEILKVVEKMTEIHNESKSQMERIKASTEKSTELIVTMQKMKQSEELIKTLTDISEAQTSLLEDNLNRIQQLSEEIKELSPLADVITEIADQTNLLALNATIEAARAGEQGRGFAVVADEVRKLSAKTNDASKSIASRIAKVTKRVEKEIENAFHILEENRGSTEFGKLFESLKEIGEKFEHTSGILEEVIHGIDSANRMIVDSVSSVLGEIQFQDVLRQRIEHVIYAMELLSNLSINILKHLRDGDEYPQESLRQYMDEIKEKYVMYEQRLTHDKVIGTPISPHDNVAPKIELF
ncbi:MAG TPA: hypothetical protein ENK42_01545 [Deltaproteobacteria bacterium]|nr:hypothetical protein [Deltaproteobacteria bacterium]